jgi:hypothetical protein
VFCDQLNGGVVVRNRGRLMSAEKCGESLRLRLRLRLLAMAATI